MTKATNEQIPGPAPLGAADLERLRSRVAELGGEAKAFSVLGIPRGTLVRALAGSMIRPGTATHILSKLQVQP